MQLALLGNPVAHSLSPAMHTAALEFHDLSGSYVARQVDPDGFQEAIDEIRSGELAGANVTMPHKYLAYQASDIASAEAAFGQSANTLMMRDGALAAISTDVPAIRSCWRAATIPTEDVLVLGAGGAAAAALVALAPFAGSLALSARRPTAAMELAGRLGFGVEVHDWDQPFSGSVINATPIGMDGERLPEQFSSTVGLFDMAYGPKRTPSVVEALERGIPYVEGIEMLIEQAALSFEWWTELAAPRIEMEAAAIS